MGNCTNGKPTGNSLPTTTSQENSQTPKKKRYEPPEQVKVKSREQKEEKRKAAFESKIQSRVEKKQTIDELKQTKDGLSSKVDDIKKQIIEATNSAKTFMLDGNEEMSKLSLEKKRIFEEYLELVKKEGENIQVVQKEVKATKNKQVADKGLNQAQNLLQDIEALLNSVSGQAGKQTVADLGNDIQKQLNQIFQEKFQKDPNEIDRQFDELEADLTKKDVINRKFTLKKQESQKKKNAELKEVKEEDDNLQEVVEVGIQQTEQVKQSDWMDEELEKLK